ncbi:molecular chaperone DnaJ [Devosia pacifica]|uniref:Molecular chaperone DnaJ n=1 Tax=Devosia pacifica TaxID=1335967 RepID=A0A918VPV5_9HYPH|nr:DnaJ domain-containing protein [Devosia pacifica]GHA18057.1 molecular chaperone DnaJ [Devosia pacifica]
MTDFDPYRVLGLGADADAYAIKSAYRRAVQTAHPDRGGDPDAFIEIVRAFDILSDADARRLFDETGTVDPEAARSLRHDVAVVLADMFDAAVKTAVDTRLPLDGVDFIEMMTKAVRGHAREAEGHARRLEGEVEALATLKRRIRRQGEGSNMFADRLDEQIEAKAQEQLQLRRRVHIFEIAVIELGNYDTEVELISALETEQTT